MNVERFQQEFFARLESIESLKQLLDQLPDISFFIKDRRGRFVMQNRRGWELCRVATERDTLGKTDHDFFTKDHADMYVAGDRQVMETGVPILNAIEPSPEEGSDRLIICSKVPLKDRRGVVIGVAGIYRDIGRARAEPRSYGRLSKAVQYLHAHYAEPLSTEELALLVGISPSQFNRRFRRLFGTTPRQYLLRVRIDAASRLLSQTELNVTQVAMDVGFYDHAHFTRTFSKLMGVSPQLYRRQRAQRSVP